MRTTEITGVFQAICAGVGIILSIVTANIAIRSFDRGPVPEKSLTYFKFGAADALQELKGGGADLKFSVNARGAELKNLFIVTTTLRNTGHAPILPEDIYDNIRISTEAPWKIITVSNKSVGGQNIAFDWTRVSDTEFKAAKALINPNDFVEITAYITRPESTPTDEDPPLKWSARISNMLQITEPVTTQFVVPQPGVLPLLIYINGNGIIFILVCFAFYLFSFLYFASASGVMFTGEVRSVCLYVGIALLSLCGAEAGNAYVFGSNLLASAPVSHWANAPWLLLTWSSLAVLIYRHAKRR